jgi:hypothetical protein
VPFQNGIEKESMFARGRNCAKTLDTSERWHEPHQRWSLLCGPASPQLIPLGFALQKL